jgi:hypothetical protein
MEFNKSGRFFAFGCSFTNYVWATWADILGQEFDSYENWGKLGAGNQFIFNSVMECHYRNQFRPGDNVIIMWTNVSREDRYIKNRWETHGNIYTYQDFYDKAYIKKYTDDRGFLIRDLAAIAAVMDLLDHWQVNYAFLSMVPLDNNGQYEREKLPDLDVLDLYAPALKKIRPSIYEVVFDHDWYSRFSSEEYEIYRGSSWPCYEDFMAGRNGTDPNIQNEIKRFRKNYLNQKNIDFSDNFISSLFNDGTIHDTHPRPMLHLEYIQKILPEISISSETISWTKSQQLDSTRIKWFSSLENQWFSRPSITRF